MNITTHHNNKFQAGFTAVEALLIIIVLLLVGLIGVYVYDRQKDDTTPVPTTSKSTSKADSTNVSDSFLVIKELGVKIPVDTTTKTVMYTVSPAEQTIVSLATDAYTTAVNDCKPVATASGSESPLLIVSKHAGIYSEAAMQENAYDTFAVQLKDFYLTTSTPDGGICPDGTDAQQAKAQQIFDSISPELTKAVKKAEVL